MIELRPATLETVRPLRLRALREDPDAFGSTLAAERDLPDADWGFWVGDSLIAFDGEAAVGMANLKLEGEGAHTMRAGSAWLQPPRIRHRVLDYSDDCEVLEIVLPADFKTVELAA